MKNEQKTTSTRETLRLMRERLGWSYYKLAQASGVSERTVREFCKGERDTTTENADAMLAAMKGKRAAL